MPLAEQVGGLAEVHSVGGQALSPLWNQIKADVLNRPVLVPRVVDAAVVGAAILCGINVGAYAGRDQAVASMVHIAQRFEPDPAQLERYTQMYTSYCQLAPTLRDAARLLHGLQ